MWNHFIYLSVGWLVPTLMKRIINFVQDETTWKWTTIYYDIINYNIDSYETTKFVPCYKYMKRLFSITPPCTKQSFQQLKVYVMW
jgi:hypothetical protein